MLEPLSVGLIVGLAPFVFLFESWGPCLLESAHALQTANSGLYIYPQFTSELFHFTKDTDMTLVTLQSDTINIYGSSSNSHLF